MKHHISRYILDDLLLYIHDRLGFRFEASNRSKLETKLLGMSLPALWPDLESFRKDLVAGNPEAHELIVRTITVNHTFFFREKDQIEYMVARIKAAGMQNPAIWCAASSTGEEAYSMVILLLEAGIRHFTLVASDVNAKVLHHMNRGIYHANRLEGINRLTILKYFVPEGEYHWRVKPELRHMIAIKKVNLVDPFHFDRKFDFIFCRNVFIYFDEKTREHVLASLCDNLKPGGYLVVGLTEALLDAPTCLAMERHAVYRLANGKEHGVTSGKDQSIHN